jgi:uncharacterized protein YggE
MRFPASLAGAVLLLGRAACAQVATPPPAPAGLGPSIMHLSAQATIKVAPDDLVACLAAIAIAPTAAAAQRRVTEMMANARTTAAGTPGARTIFRGYAVFYSEEKPPHWTAQQTLEVRGGDGEVALDLVGRLQALGLALEGLGWEVSPERAEQTRQDATLKALVILRKQATEGARVLGMEVDRFQSVSLNDAPPGVTPMARAEAAGVAAVMAPMPPPNATAVSQDMIVSVSAEVVLAMPARAP